MAITGKAPVTYEDWRRIYHRELSAMGFCAKTYFGVRFSQSDSPFPFRNALARTAYRHWHRLDRVERQLHEAFDRMDSTCVSGILRMLGLEEDR
jgi:hypothetical protein